jgi:hypothetical protein
VNDIEALDNPFFSLDDNYICDNSIGNYVEFASIACNIFERRRCKRTLYVTTLFKMQEYDHDMPSLTKTCFYLFMYEMPMHRKRVTLKSRLLNVLWWAPYALNAILFEHTFGAL